MDHVCPAPQVISVELSQLQGRELAALLREPSAVSDSQVDVGALESLCDRLDDANALAIWLRENVRVEFAPSELSQVLGQLAARREQHASRGDADAALAETANRLWEHMLVYATACNETRSVPGSRADSP